MGNLGWGGVEWRPGAIKRATGWESGMYDDAAKTQDALRRAASDPGWASAQANIRNNASGANLGGGNAYQGIWSKFARQNNQQDPTYGQTLRGDFVNQAAQDPRFRIGGGINSALGQMYQSAGRPSQVTQNTLSGAYLNSTPQVNADEIAGAIRRASGAQAADQGANLRSAFSRAGLGFSTAQSQAQQASQAAAAARANELEAQTRFGADQANQGAYLAERGIQSATALSEDAAQRDLAQFGAGARIAGHQFDSASGQQRLAQERGYQTQAALDAQQGIRSSAQFEAGNRANQYSQERLYQNQSPEQLSQALGVPLSYLSQVPKQQLAALSQVAGFIQQMTAPAGSGIAQTQFNYEPGVWDHFVSLVGAAAGLAGK